MMRQRDKGLCLNVAARRGAECNTDHHFVCMKLRLKRTPGGRVGKGVKCKRFDVEKLRDKCNGVEEESVKSQYLQGVLERAEDEWCDEAGVEGQWSAVKSALVSTEKVLGRTGHLQPGWFQESIEALQPLLVARNAGYSRWLGTGRMEDLSKFQQARSTAKRAIRKAKNDWFQEKAREIEREVWGGRCGRSLERCSVDAGGYSHVSRQSFVMRRVSHAAAKKPSNSSGGGTLPRCSTSGVSLRSATEGDEWEYSRQAYCKRGEESVREVEEWEGSGLFQHLARDAQGWCWK